MNNIKSEPITSPSAIQREGPIARSIEQQTAKIPSDAFLMLAGGSIVAALALKLSGRNESANFVGQWVPAILILGLYNKLVKLEGSDGV